MHIVLDPPRPPILQVYACMSVELSLVPPVYVRGVPERFGWGYAMVWYLLMVGLYDDTYAR
jgi:hypothetical protein